MHLSSGSTSAPSYKGLKQREALGQVLQFSGIWGEGSQILWLFLALATGSEVLLFTHTFTNKEPPEDPSLP